MELEFSQENFEKESIIKFRENPCSWSRTVLCGRTDGQRHDEANSLFRNFANAPNKTREDNCELHTKVSGQKNRQGSCSTLFDKVKHEYGNNAYVPQFSSLHLLSLLHEDSSLNK
jgi:hypothetical protein